MTPQHDRLAIFAGYRTPFGRMGGALASLGAVELGTLAVRELLLRTGLDPARVDAVVTGNVGQPSNAANLSRVIALRAGIPAEVPASTVHRNCASGFEALTTCFDQLRVGRGRLFVAAGVESMSDYPLHFGPRARRYVQDFAKARSGLARVRAALAFRPSMLKPEIALLKGLTDPVAGIGMGETAELLAREWRIDREAQDAFAARSHARALAARAKFREETFDVVAGDRLLRDDEGVRQDSTPAKLATLRPAFARSHGSVTAGNSSQISDGAVALLVGDPGLSRDLGIEPLGCLRDFAWAGLAPQRMGLGPVHAVHRLFPDDPHPFDGVDLVEINEAFAAQVLACRAAALDAAYCRHALGRDVPLGVIDDEKLNPNGGAIALGHPVGASGARLVLTALHELRRRRGRRALVTLCVGGGQGGALLLARE